MHDALSQLASKDNIKEITHELLLSIKDMEAGDDNKTLDLNLDSQIELNWKEGVKSLVQTTENVEQAWPAREEVTIFPTVD